MASEGEIAIEVLPHFAKSVLAKRRRTYGHYAVAIGRRTAEGIVMGKAMHAIGAACVFASVPVAPLYYVERQDHGWRGIFESDQAEREQVLPFYDLLRVTAREYDYTQRDFDIVDAVLREVLPLLRQSMSPHEMWHVALHPFESGDTFFSRAVGRYQGMLDLMRRA
jgi:hypothetical protein